MRISGWHHYCINKPCLLCKILMWLAVASYLINLLVHYLIVIASLSSGLKGLRKFVSFLAIAGPTL